MQMEILARQSSLGACLLTELFIDESYTVCFQVPSSARELPMNSKSRLILVGQETTHLPQVMTTLSIFSVQIIKGPVLV